MPTSHETLARSRTSGAPLRRLRRLVPDIAAEAADTARAQVLAYAWGRPDDRDLLREAVAVALAAFLGSPEPPCEPPAQALRAFRELGGAEAAGGRGPDDLRALLSVTIGVVAEHLTEEAARHGVDLGPGRGGALLRTGLAYSDRLRQAAAAGHYAVDARDAGGAGRERRRLVELLLRAAPDPGELREAAARAGWPLPRTVAAIAVGGRRGPAAPSRFLPADVLSGLHLDVPCLIFPDPGGAGRRAVLETMLGDHPAVVGPTVEVTRAALSLRLACRGLDLLPSDVLSAGGPVHVREHIPTLLLVQNPELTRRLADRKLAPLRRLRPLQQARLVETLLAYFECGFNANSAAVRLHTHPQTVRNRIRRLEPLFGPDLYDPASALDYLMALHSWRLDAAAGDGAKTVPRRTKRTA
ncbi:PucR family transcriptional regulator [Actinomadura monticuli]|uniref:Helix-turn-helix domain-containing protein n=1 Tax=Actinomadura monticuli TaxID=3097367 RepID=A0ABV4Q6D3_9ACTN